MTIFLANTSQSIQSREYISVNTVSGIHLSQYSLGNNTSQSIQSRATISAVIQQLLSNEEISLQNTARNRTECDNALN